MRFSTVAVVSAAVLAVFASSVCEARGGRAFGGRSFSRPLVSSWTATRLAASACRA